MKLTPSRLSYRYLLNFLLFIIIPVMILLFLISSYYTRITLEQSEQRMEKTVSGMAVNLDNEIKNMFILTSALSHNQAFLERCRTFNGSKNPSEYYQNMNALDQEVTNVFHYTNKIGLLNIFFTKQQAYRFQNFPIVNEISLPNAFMYSLQKRIVSLSNLVYVDNNLFSLSESFDPEFNDPLLTLLVKPVDYGIDADVEMITFSLRIKLFQDIYNELSKETFSFVTDAQGGLLLGSMHHGLSESILAKLGGGETGTILTVDDWLLTRAQIPATGWYIYYASNMEAIRKSVERIRLITMLILVLLIGLFLLYSLKFFHDLIHPVNLLITEMQEVETGDYSVQANPSGPKEMQHLIESFNSMVGKVGELTEYRRLQEKEKGQLELEALQYQINPHFIGNTLNSIRLMAVLNKDEHIKEMTASLIKLVNSSYRGKGNLTTLQQERENLTGYVHIMKVRFGNRIDIFFDIPQELEQCVLLKMLLQPVVENSIVHGFVEQAGKGIITITAAREEAEGVFSGGGDRAADEAEAVPGSDTDPGSGFGTGAGDRIGTEASSALLITVEDNGSGFLWEADNTDFPDPHNTPGGFTSLGLRNIHRRIQLNSGPAYGVAITSTPGEGTKVILRLPLSFSGDDGYEQ